MPDLKLIQLTDLSAPAGEVCGPDGCFCGHEEAAADDAAHAGRGRAAEIEFSAATSEKTASYGVAGMTCGHCVAAVMKELKAIPGVEAVDVELVAGGVSTVTVGSEQPIGAEAIRTAIEEAGYELV